MRQEMIFQRIKKIFFETFEMDPDSLTMETGMNDIPQWSSLTHMYMVDRIEEEFDVQFSAKDIEKAISILIIIQLIENKKNQNEKN